MINKDIAIVLGGTYPHISLIENLKQRGYFTVLLDYYKNPSAKFVADEHIQKSTLDKDAVLEISRQRNAKLIISTCIDQANVTACYVAEKLGLSTPYSYSTALNVSNKSLMKKMMIENGIPTSKFVALNDIHDFDSSKLCFPLIVKPTDSNSSKGVRKVKNIEELYRNFNNALKISRIGDVIIEEFIVGREVGADCYIQNNEVTLLITRERRKVLLNSTAEQQIQGSFWPADITESQKLELKKIIRKIADVFNLNNTTFMIQTIINERGINVIEFAPRIGGGENYRIIELYSGFDIINSAVDSFLCRQTNLKQTNSEYIYADIYLYTEKSIFGEIIGYDNLISDGIIEYLNIYKTKGVEIGSEISSNNRVGAFLVKSRNRKGLAEKISIALESIEVNDINGKPIMRKDIYEKFS